MQAEQASIAVLPPVPQSLADIDLDTLLPEEGVHPSPRWWNDQVCYFLLPDRFSDGKEGERELFKKDRAAEFALSKLEKESWVGSAMQWQGGNLRGIMSHLPYLKEMGITTLWLGPIYKQRKDEPTYHGYAIQNFLDVDPHLGTREDLVELVRRAHRMGMYVLLDIIFNHTGDNFFYKHEGKMKSTMPYKDKDRHPFGAWKDEHGKPCREISSIEDGVWPREFQDPEWYFRAGSIKDWNKYPEYVRGDFMTLKAFNLDRGDTLSALIEVYRYWIALTDCDGFRVDTVKHVPLGASHRFCQSIHEFAQSIGKDKFLLVGEVSGPAPMRMRFLGGGLPFAHNLDAVLDIGEQSKRLCNMFKLDDKSDLQLVFQPEDAMENLREIGGLHFSILDDHDMIWQHPQKARVGHINEGPMRERRVAHLTGVQLTLPGIPCIYYGSEQALTGHGDGDKYLRENLFGGAFAAFATKGCHFFDRQHPAYLRIAAIAHLRSRPDKIGLALRHGRLYVRDVCPIAFATKAQREETEKMERAKSEEMQSAREEQTQDLQSLSSDGIVLKKKNKNKNSKIKKKRMRDRAGDRNLRLSEEEAMQDEKARKWRGSRRGEVLAWSRVHYNVEVLVVLNTHPTEERRSLVTVDRRLQERKHAAKVRADEEKGDHAEPSMTLIYHSEWTDAALVAMTASDEAVLATTATTTEASVPVHQQKDGRHFVSITLPPAGMAILL